MVTRHAGGISEVKAQLRSVLSVSIHSNLQNSMLSSKSWSLLHASSKTPCHAQQQWPLGTGFHNKRSELCSNPLTLGGADTEEGLPPCSQKFCTSAFSVQCDFPAGLFPPRDFFHSALTPISCQSPVPISAVWASSAAAKWQDPVTDDRNICVEEDDRAALAEEFCKANNSPDCWQLFK